MPFALLHESCARTKLWPRSTGYRAQGMKWSTQPDAGSYVGTTVEAMAGLNVHERRTESGVVGPLRAKQKFASQRSFPSAAERPRCRLPSSGWPLFGAEILVHNQRFGSRREHLKRFQKLDQ